MFLPLPLHFHRVCRSVSLTVCLSVPVSLYLFLSLLLALCDSLLYILSPSLSLSHCLSVSLSMLSLSFSLVRDNLSRSFSVCCIESSRILPETRNLYADTQST